VTDKGRVEAFSDGVLAIAITLLVLELRVPDPGLLPHGLAHALAQEWSSYAAYLLSFVVIGIMWVNHHAVFARVVNVDRPLLLLNLHLLLWIAVLPFPTALVARYIRQGDDARVAMAVYSGVMTATSIAWALLWLWITRDARLLHRDIDPRAARASARRFTAGLFAYVLTVAVSFVSPVAALVLHFVIAGYYVFDQLVQPQGAPPGPG
jgi:uncharacterized membrane protein